MADKRNAHLATGNRPAEDARTAVRSHTETSTRTVRLSLAALLGATALLYLVGLSASGYANEFYSAAAQAGSTNWWSFLWGSSDAGNSITVDKPPAALWPMALSVRIFGLSSWSILVPQAIMGVLSVWLLYATVRRTYGHWAGILAGAVLATTPIACLMFRFNNPDALLMLLLLACCHCVLRASELPDERTANRSRTRWMALAGVAMGFAFLTKQLQAFLILPGIGIAFLVTSPTGWRRKLLDTLAAFGALFVSAGWWVLLTVVVPADARPYIGGSQTNSFIELTFSYNGLGRITGSMEGAVLPGGGSTTISQGQAGMWGQTGITRLFDGVWGTQWSWLAWVALAGIVVGIVCARKDIRSVQGSHERSVVIVTNPSVGENSSAGAISTPSLGHLKLAQIIIWGCWLLVTGLIFSFMGGTIHQYYTVALAPAVAALVAICVTELWHARRQPWTLITACVLTGVTTVWATILLERSDWVWQLRPITLALGAAAVFSMLAVWRKRGKQPTDTSTDPDADSAPTTSIASDTNATYDMSTAPSMAAPSASIVLTADQPTDRVAASALEKVALGLALASALVGPVAYSLYTAATPHTGSIVTAGPSVQDDSGMGGQGGHGQGGMGGPGGMGGQGTGKGGPGQIGATDGNSNQQDGQDTDGTMPAPPNGMGNGTETDSGADNSNAATNDAMGTAPTTGTAPTNADGTNMQQGAQSGNGGGRGDGGNGGAGGMGGLLGGSASSVSEELVAAIQEDAGSYRWVAATVGSQNAASYQLASECPVMPIGGFNGSDPSPTLEQFEEWVAAGKIHYFVAGGGVGGGTQIGGSDDASQITAWVEKNFTATTIGSVTVYDLTQSAS